MRIVVLIFSILLYFACDQQGTLSSWESLSICLFVYFLLDFLAGLGNRIVILDLSLIIASLTCLLLPVIFYHTYTVTNPLAKLWAKYMPIPSDEYFSFAVPSVIAMAIGYRIPVVRLKYSSNPKRYLDNVKEYLADKPKLGLILIGVGVGSGIVGLVMPAILKEVFFLSSHLTFVGVFYVIYSPRKNKRNVIIFVLTLMLGQTIATGMFGEMVNMLACSVVLILLGRKISFPLKLGIAVAGVFFLLVLQAVKIDYRKRTWHEDTGADPFYFGQLITEKTTDPSALFDNPNKLFFVAVRANQGWLVARTMYSVPNRFPFANGETIWESVAAAIVPRLLWPDKPESGGKANLKRFWGYNLSGFSMNIGPMGEAYANFGAFGGIIYMFFYGLFFNVMMSIILKKAERRPSLVLWIPFLFFYAIGVETDLLTTMGSLIKGVMFTAIVFWVFRARFNIKL
jgi:hypothetical protein